MKIDIKMPWLLKQKPLEVKQSFVELTNTHIRYCVEFTAEEWINNEDEELGKKEEFNFIDVLALKKNIPGVEISNTINPPRYKIVVPVSGFGNDIIIYFKKRDEAQELKNIIDKWLLA